MDSPSQGHNAVVKGKNKIRKEAKAYIKGHKAREEDEKAEMESVNSFELIENEQDMEGSEVQETTEKPVDVKDEQKRHETEEVEKAETEKVSIEDEVESKPKKAKSKKLKQWVIEKLKEDLEDAKARIDAKDATIRNYQAKNKELQLNRDTIHSKQAKAVQEKYIKAYMKAKNLEEANENLETLLGVSQSKVKCLEAVIKDMKVQIQAQKAQILEQQAKEEYYALLEMIEEKEDQKELKMAGNENSKRAEVVQKKTLKNDLLQKMKNLVVEDMKDNAKEQKKDQEVSEDGN